MDPVRDLPFGGPSTHELFFGPETRSQKYPRESKDQRARDLGITPHFRRASFARIRSRLEAPFLRLVSTDFLSTTLEVVSSLPSSVRVPLTHWQIVPLGIRWKPPPRPRKLS